MDTTLRTRLDVADRSAPAYRWTRLWRIFAQTDPRHFQIVALGTLLVVGVARLDFPLTLEALALTFGTALTVQWLGCVHAGRRFDPRSALITSLSLLLILRSGAAWTMALAALLAIGSKFVLRFDGRHLFNPANFGIVVVVLCTADAWVSPGQWGRTTILMVAFAGLGLVVTTSARRLDITIAFLLAYAAGLFGRALWLGDPLTIPWRSLQSGTLLLFAFFMISDPKTTPRSRAGRIAFAVLVACAALLWGFGLHRPNGFLFALAVCLPLVPLIDRLRPGAAYRWRRSLSEAQSVDPRHGPARLPERSAQIIRPVPTTMPATQAARRSS